MYRIEVILYNGESTMEDSSWVKNMYPDEGSIFGMNEKSSVGCRFSINHEQEHLNARIIILSS